MHFWQTLIKARFSPITQIIYQVRKEHEVNTPNSLRNHLLRGCSPSSIWGLCRYVAAQYEEDACKDRLTLLLDGRDGKRPSLIGLNAGRGRSARLYEEGEEWRQPDQLDANDVSTDEPSSIHLTSAAGSKSRVFPIRVPSSVLTSYRSQRQEHFQRM
jgi:hypothetical protein